MMEMHSHKKFWLAIVILTIVAVTFIVATAWMSNEMEAIQAQRANVEAELAMMEAELATVGIELDASKELIESLEAELFNLQVNYERLITGYGYVLKDPSYQEMQDFLTQDMTSEQEYVEGRYTCVDFAADVKANAVRKGIRCAYVVIEHRWGGGHTIVAFDTTDEGLVYIEPQFDWEVEPEIGQRYYQCVVPPPGHYMVKPDSDDTIARIVVIW